MTMQQTHELMLTLLNSNAVPHDFSHADMGNIIDALKKQIPEKAKVELNFYGPNYYCPICDAPIEKWPASEYGDYCKHCGQAIEIK